jgi:hypothetical protein
MKTIYKNITHILVIFILCIPFCGYAQKEKTDGIAVDIILDEQILRDFSINTNFINSIDYTPNNFLLLSSSNQFYLLGIGGMDTIFNVTENEIDGFVVTQDNTLLMISENKLCQVDSLGVFVEILNLPSNKMGIVSGKDIVYLFDRNIQEGWHYNMYQYPTNKAKEKMELLFVMSTPILSAFEYKSTLFFSTENRLMCTDDKSKKLIEILSLPQKDDKIISIVGDTINHAFYFSTDSAVYRIKGDKLEYITNEFGGILKYDGEGLLIFNPEKQLIVRFRNNILYASSQTTTQDLENVAIIEKSTNKIDAIDYVTPLKILVDFFTKQQLSFSETVQNWQNSIDQNINEINEANNRISLLEKELNEKKNATAKGSSQEINELKNDLSNERTIYKGLKTGMITKGTLIAMQLKKYEKEQSKLINQQFNDVKKQIVPASTFPATSKVQVPVLFSGHTKNIESANYLEPANELLVWYYNVERSFQEIIKQWNQKAVLLIEKDKILFSQLSQKEKQLEEYKKNPKNYKKEINSTKKDIAQLWKERKVIAKQMKTDSKDLSNYVQNYCSEIQNSYKERMKDVIEEINYLFQEKTNL